ncbi:MAG: glycosyltransferase family 2 protein [Pseudomonadota bacterium]
MIANDLPLVTVVIPLYNAEGFVAETVQSALAQTYSNIEIIVVDDGSTDRSPAIVKSFNDSRMIYVRQANAGVSVARNTGLARAKGAVVAFLDSDDLWDAHKIEKHVDHLMRNPAVGVSYSACRFIDANGNALASVYRPKQTGVTPADLYCRNPIAGGSSAVFRREIFEAIIEPHSGDGIADYFDPRASASGASYAEDHQCWLRMALHSPLQFEGVDEVLTSYRLHDAGLSAKVENMHQGWTAIDAYVAQHAPDLHRTHSGIANAYQMRYFARRLVAMGDAPRALSYMARSLRASVAPVYQEPRKTLSTIAAAIAMLIVPGLVKRMLNPLKQSVESVG